MLVIFVLIQVIELMRVFLSCNPNSNVSYFIEHFPILRYINLQKIKENYVQQVKYCVKRNKTCIWLIGCCLWLLEWTYWRSCFCTSIMRWNCGGIPFSVVLYITTNTFRVNKKRRKLKKLKWRNESQLSVFLISPSSLPTFSHICFF